MKSRLFSTLNLSLILKSFYNNYFKFYLKNYQIYFKYFYILDIKNFNFGDLKIFFLINRINYFCNYKYHRLENKNNLKSYLKYF